MIYIARCKTSGKSYVGQTVNTLADRIMKHVSDGKKTKAPIFPKALRSKGVEAFTFITIDGVPDEFLNGWEAYFIKEFDSVHPNGYNLTTGGGQQGRPCEEARRKMRLSHVGTSSWNKGIPNTEEQKRKNSLANLGRKATPATIEACRKTGLSHKGKAPWNKGRVGGGYGYWKGKHLTEEMKEKISKTRKGKYTGEKASMFGEHLSDEAKKKISMVQLGRIKSAETRAKISAGNKGKPRSEEARRRMSIAQLKSWRERRVSLSKT